MTLGDSRSPADENTYVGSVKTNLGHTEGAAGVASLIKVILCLEKGYLVPNCGFKKLNPKIRLDEWRLRLCNETIPWPAHLVQRASINSFGFGGSNAHAILESASEFFGKELPSTSPDSIHRPRVIVFSSFDQAGIDRIATTWSDFAQNKLKDGGNMSLKDLAHTMLIRRSHLSFRSFAVANSLTDLHRALETGLPKFSRTSRNAQTRLAFFFTGQGGQWPGMGRELLQMPIFCKSIATSQEILTSLGCRFDIIEEITAEAKESHINQPDRSQPITCALQIALVDLLQYWGVYPNAVVGHSSGEIGMRHCDIVEWVDAGMLTFIFH